MCRHTLICGSHVSSHWGLCVPQVGNYATLFSQALPRDAHSTPFYCTRPQSLALGYGERTLSASLGTSGISSLGVYTLNGPTPTPQSLLAGWAQHSPVNYFTVKSFVMAFVNQIFFIIFFTFWSLHHSVSFLEKKNTIMLIMTNNRFIPHVNCD